MIKENELRDLICERIELLGDDLTLLNKEKYIPNSLGTKGFIDIYAKDKDNNHVLIELKRSNQAARQALHEVIKYAEGVKSYFGANDDEIKLIIASTEWSELLVPFSSLTHNTPFFLKGVKIHLDGIDIVTENIEPLKYNKGRFISPKYEVFWYKDESSLNDGIISIRKELNESGINNFLLSILKTKIPIPSPSKERRKEMLMEIARLRKIKTTDTETELFSYILFLSTQTMSSSEHLDIIKRTKPKEIVDEVVYSISDVDEEQQSDILYEYTFDFENIHSDDMEIGNPAKFSHYLNTQEIKLHKIIREGFFAFNKNLTDETILTELKGNKGNSAQKLQVSMTLNNNQKLNGLKENIRKLLDTNLAWQSQILQILNEIEKNHPNSLIDLNIYHPRTALFSIYYTIKNINNHESYLPCYTLSVKNEQGTTLKKYFGCLEKNGSSMLFQDVIKKYYNDNIQNLIHTITWGGTDDRDDEILDDVGLSYMSFHHDLDTDKTYVLINNKWREHDIKKVNGYFDDFIQSNHELISELFDEISFFDQGNIFAQPEIETHIIIERSEIESLDTSKVYDFFEFAISSISMARYLQGQIEISINGYDSDGELYMIDDVRTYMRKVSNEVKYLFFFINPNGVSQILKYFLLAFSDIKSESIGSGGQIKLNIELTEVDSFLTHQFSGLNELTDRCNMSIDENKEITFSVLDCMGISH
ncbi:endonuclease NucS domain-containing protein [Serratia plymuthica]|uniref:endonuclease NucS domain-containing protein n=1 Tax=Serratia plymuthica TaxID=82996 RepID=UPI0007EB17C2|nr:endonuclease NucS domain-containing protein [Serratia plymuthica]ANJ95111.1 hypothetical protein ADP72_19925 [Serratia plymuthica]